MLTSISLVPRLTLTPSLAEMFGTHAVGYMYGNRTTLTWLWAFSLTTISSLSRATDSASIAN